MYGSGPRGRDVGPLSLYVVVAIFSLFEHIFGFVVDVGAMFVERACHSAVALAERMDMSERNSEQDRVIQHIRHVEVAVAVRDNEQVVAFVIKFLAVLDDDMIVGIDFYIERVETSVARHRHRAFAMECAVVGVILLFEVHVDFDIRLQDASMLHILEELCIADEVLLVFPVRKRGQLNFICREFSHFNIDILEKSATKIVSLLILTNCFGHFFYFCCQLWLIFNLS